MDSLTRGYWLLLSLLQLWLEGLEIVDFVKWMWMNEFQCRLSRSVSAGSLSLIPTHLLYFDELWHFSWCRHFRGTRRDTETVPLEFDETGKGNRKELLSQYCSVCYEWWMKLTYFSKQNNFYLISSIQRICLIFLFLDCSNICIIYKLFIRWRE